MWEHIALAGELVDCSLSKTSLKAVSYWSFHEKVLISLASRMRNFFFHVHSISMIATLVCRRDNARMITDMPISIWFWPWGHRFTSLCCRAEHWPIQQWAGRISLVFFTCILHSHKTWCILLFIQFQPYPWPDLILLCWHMLYVCVQQSPSCEGIYLPEILKTDFTEPSTSKGYWDRMVMWIPPSALWVGTKGVGWEHNEVINIYIH